MHESIPDLADFTANHSRVVILFINANPDSQPCTTAATKFDELEDTYPDVEFVRLSTGDKDNAKLFSKHGDGKMPLFLTFKDGKKFGEAVSVNKTRVDALIRSLIKDD